MLNTHVEREHLLDFLEQRQNRAAAAGWELEFQPAGIRVPLFDVAAAAAKLQSGSEC